jgi:3-isopropylmalate dehydrogenase
VSSGSVLLLAGDGIGPEVTEAARRVLDTVRPGLAFSERLVGRSAVERIGAPYEPDLPEYAGTHDAILFGAVGGDNAPGAPWEARPEAALFALRERLGLFANLRPIRVLPSLADRSVLKPERLAGVDVLIVRELTGGLYFGAKTRTADHATDTCGYSRSDIERIVRTAFGFARARRGRLTSVDKANILVTSLLWREVVEELAREFPDVEVEHLLVDNAALQLLLRPQTFDVLVTENLFGDILSDEAAALLGGLGLVPSASLAESGPGLYEPAHGTAPDIAGLGIANPCGAILSVALMLRFTFGDEEAARVVERSVEDVLAAGIRTPDLGGDASTTEFTDEVLARLVASDSALSSDAGRTG